MHSHESGYTEEIVSTTSGIREYALERGKSTELLIEGAIVQATNKIMDMAKEDIDKGVSTEDILIKYAGRAVSEVTKQHMRSGLSIPRVILGGRYKLEDVINAASCIDAAYFNKLVLEEGFGMECDVETTRLGVVPNHHYLRIKSTGQIVDSVLHAKNNPGGFFEKQEDFDNKLSLINNGGIAILRKQIINIISPKDSESSADENQIRTLATETASAKT